MKQVHVVHLASAHQAKDVRIFEKQCSSLAMSGYKVTFIVPHSKDEAVDGVNIRGVKVPGSRLQRMTATGYAILREALRQKADLYHFHDPDLIPVGMYLKKSGKNVIFDIHEDVSSQILHMRWLPRWSRPIAALTYSKIQRLAARRFSALVTANEEITIRVSGLNQRIVTICNYPLLKEFQEPMTVNTERYASRVLVDFGGLGFRTGTREIVTAMGLLPKSLGARLTLAGFVESAELMRQLQELPGWELVDFVGRIPRAQMLDRLRNASVALILFSRNPNNFGIGSNRFFEALAAGLPVVTSDFPRWKDIVERVGCGLTVNPDDPYAIAQAITRLLTNPAECREMGSRAQEAIVNQFNWDIEKLKLLALYQSLTGRPTGANLNAVTNPCSVVKCGS